MAKKITIKGEVMTVNKNKNQASLSIAVAPEETKDAKGNPAVATRKALSYNTTDTKEVDGLNPGDKVTVTIAAD